MDITRAKIRDLRKALDSKQISAAELCGEYFRNIEAGDGKVQSFITVTKENTDTGHLYVLTVPFGARATLRLNRAKTICVNGKPVSNGASLTHGIYRIETT